MGLVDRTQHVHPVILEARGAFQPRSGSGTQHKKCPKDTLYGANARVLRWVPGRPAPETARSAEDDGFGYYL